MDVWRGGGDDVVLRTEPPVCIFKIGVFVWRLLLEPDGVAVRVARADAPVYLTIGQSVVVDRVAASPIKY